MSEGTNVGNIFLDLIVRDTVEKQVQDIAAKGQQTAQKAFSSMERTAENAANKVASQAGKLGQKAAEMVTRPLERAAENVKKFSLTPAEKAMQKAQERAGKAAEKVQSLEAALEALNHATNAQIADEVKAFSDSVEAAQKNIDRLVEQIVEVKNEMAKAPSKTLSHTMGMLMGQYHTATEALKNEQAILDKQTEEAFTNANSKFSAQQEKLLAQLTAAREKYAKIVAQISAMESVMPAYDIDQEEPIRKRMRAFADAVRRDAEDQIKTEKKTAAHRKKIFSSMWKNMLSHAGNSAKSISSKITGIIKQFTTAGKATRRFGTRLREIVRGALIFNGISAALRGMVNYMGQSITASDSMKKSLANLKGAAANAASPLIQVLTPALTKLANATATALTYVERLTTRLTGKVSTAAATAAKNAEASATSAAKGTKKAVDAAKKAQRTLMGFDTLNRIDGKAETTAEDGSEESDAIKPNYSYKGFNSFLESALAAIEAGRWAQVGELIAEKLNGILSKVKWDAIQQKVKTWTGNLTDALNGFVHKVDWPLLGGTIGEGLNTLTTIIDSFFRGFNWEALGAGFSAGLNRLFDTVDWAQLGRVLTDKLMALFGLLHGFVVNFDFAGLGTSLAQMLNAAFDNINWDQLWQDIKTGLAKLFDGICAFFAELEPDLLSAAINVLLIKAAFAAFKTLGPIIADALTKKLLESLPKVFGQWMSALKTWATGTLLPKVTGWITGTLAPKVTTALYAISSTLGISVGWVAAIGAAIAALVVLVVKNWDKIVEWTKKTWQKIKDIWNAAPEWFNEKIIEPVVSFFSDLWHRAQELGEEAWAKMRQTWQNVSGWFAQHVVQPIRDAFASVYSFVSEIWSSIVSFIKNAVNNVIGSINGMISGIVNGINTVIRALNRLSFTVPEWLRHVPGAANIAGKRFGFDLKTLTAPQIPYLADGGVIKQPTLAMVGEYSGASNNPEIVAPQSLIAETVASVMNDMMHRNQMSLAEIASILRQILNAVVTIGSGGIQIIIGGKEVFQVVVDENNRAILRNGKSPLKV